MQCIKHWELVKQMKTILRLNKIQTYDWLSNRLSICFDVSSELSIVEAKLTALRVNK
jgi:hypothetical protein